MTGGRAPGQSAGVLLYRAIGLGDFLTGVPAYRAAVRAWPDETVVLAAPAPLAPLVRLVGGVQHLPTPELAVPRWAGGRPRVAVNLHGVGPQSTRALQQLQPQRLLAWRNDDAGVDGPQWRRDEHEIDRWCRLLVESGVPADLVDRGDFVLGEPAADPPVAGATVLHPGAAGAPRRWPADRFAELARALAADGHQVVVTGGPDEVDLADRVVDLAGLPAARCWAGRLDLDGLAALVRAARLVVCGDTGVAHLATAYVVPSVTILGPVSPDRWGPPAHPRHQVVWHADLANAPASSDGAAHPAVAAVTVDEVMAAARRATAAPSGTGKGDHRPALPTDATRPASLGGAGR